MQARRESSARSAGFSRNSFESLARAEKAVLQSKASLLMQCFETKRRAKAAGRKEISILMRGEN